MQTFLIAPGKEGIRTTSQILDDRRLKKQSVEAYQILRALCGLTKGWRHHPATLMWKNHEVALVEYGQIMCEECVNRGIKDTVSKKLIELLRNNVPLDSTCRWILPSWTSDPKFYIAHRSNLIRKDSEYYQRFWPDVKPDLPYYWPSKEKKYNV